MSMTYNEYINKIQSSNGSAVEIINEFRDQINIDFSKSFQKLQEEEKLFLEERRNISRELNEKISKREAVITDDKFEKIISNANHFEKLLKTTKTEGLFLDTAATMFFVCDQLKAKVSKPEFS